MSETQATVLINLTFLLLIAALVFTPIYLAIHYSAFWLFLWAFLLLADFLRVEMIKDILRSRN